jgi:oligoribonuclease NrnB/cAMP/cGMP phosphodiesterase (DHH superfamily)
MKEKKNFLYTHDDMDGIVSALLIKAVFKAEHGEDVTIKFCNYGEEFDYKASKGYTRVLFTDFVPNDMSMVEKIAEDCFDLSIIDHHASKFKDINDLVAKHKNINCYLAEDEGCSAAMMVFKTCFPHIKEPHRFFTLVSNFDTFYMPNGKYSFYDNELSFMTGFMNYHGEKAKIDDVLYKAVLSYVKMADDRELDIFTNQILSNGRMLFAHQRKLWEKTCKRNGFLADVLGYKAICLNINDVGSMQFDYLADKHPERILFGFQMKKDGSWSISMYENKSGVDVGQIAKDNFNGGGHKGASGGNYVGDIMTLFKNIEIPE